MLLDVCRLTPYFTQGRYTPSTIVIKNLNGTWSVQKKNLDEWTLLKYVENVVRVRKARGCMSQQSSPNGSPRG